MCWVMPPNSASVTFDERMASSSDVLPWSTWPMMVTTGARGTCGLAAASAPPLLAAWRSWTSSSKETTMASTPRSLGQLQRQLGLQHVVDVGHDAALEERA